MKKTVIHFVQHSCGPQECDCSPRCHPREGDEIVTSSSVAAVTCKNCLRGLKKDLHPDLPKSKTVAEERDQLKAEVEALRKDAERYQWITDGSRGDLCCSNVLSEEHRELSDSLDGAVDAAMSKESGHD